MKYMGSKDKIGGMILKHMPTKGRVYVEPFAGGLNMMAKVFDAETRYAYDNNPYVVAMFNALLDGWVPHEIEKDEYAELRGLKGDKHVIGWAGVACSFRGKWFGGFAGKQSGRDYQEEARRNWQKQKPGLVGVEIQCCEYTELDLVTQIPEGSVVYCDPPYSDTTGYMSGFDHEIFWDWVRSISDGRDVFVSEIAAPADFEVVWEQEVTCSMSLGERQYRTEKLFKHSGI